MEIFFKMLLRKKYFRDSQIISPIKSLTKISTKNAQQYVAFGEDLYGDRLTARNLNENLKKSLTKIFLRVLRVFRGFFGGLLREKSLEEMN